MISEGTGLHFYLTSWEGFVLHDDSAAAGQYHDVQLLLLVVSLLVPLSHHISVMGWNKGDLTPGRKRLLNSTKKKCYLEFNIYEKYVIFLEAEIVDFDYITLLHRINS